MFDYRESYMRTVHFPYEKSVTIKAAPTDESIRLYEEIKQKAYDSIISTIDCKDNALKITAIYWKDYLSDAHKCGYIFNLNGKEIRDVISLDWCPQTDHDVKVEIYKRIGFIIANEFMKELKTQ